MRIQHATALTDARSAAAPAVAGEVSLVAGGTSAAAGLLSAQRRYAGCPDHSALHAALVADLSSCGYQRLLLLGRTSRPRPGSFLVLGAHGDLLLTPGRELTATDLERMRPGALVELVPGRADAPVVAVWGLAGEQHPGAEVLVALAGAVWRALRAEQTASTAEDEAERRRRLLEAASRLSDFGRWVFDPETGVVTLDDRLREMLGLPVGTSVVDPGPWLSRIHPDDRGAFTPPTSHGGSGLSPAPYPFRLRPADTDAEAAADEETRTFLGITVHAGRGTISGLVSPVREGGTDELVRLAQSDSLTGLANRTLLDTRLADALRSATPSAEVALVLIDLDRFKLVNDTLGHQVGDVLLQRTAAKIVECAPPGATLARLGGDEFVLMVPGVDRPEAALVMARNLLRRLRMPVLLPGLAEPTVCTASAGVAVGHHGSSDDLFRSADMALYRAKDDGRDRCALYDAAMQIDAQSRREAEHKVRRALRTNGLRVLWQPIVDLRDDDRLVAAEALVRIDDPVEGTLEPGTFVDTAEDTGLIVDVDTWVLGEVLRQLREWRGKGSGIQVSFNVSGKTLEHPAFAHRLAHSVESTGASGASLLAEVTERTLIDLSTTTRASLGELRSIGARVGLDDFGTGYSSLAYLDRFPLSFLKIDMSFVRDLGRSDRADAVVEALIGLAHAHGMVVTAEGVETRLQAETLRRMGCDRAQGWLFGRPMTATKLPVRYS
ncbi:putative bifunctional diguanylate cyclase/phosphodiesterase [Kineococcus gynurae]|uniref:Bifunctional diguanylate cyclase/phosphodiesterase n=1 Tax=Kineococcus gynurae TaxID=452979 RepID=A0ABV5LWG4_9ACTN